MIELRSLRQEELPAWYQHCASVFTGEAPEYFQRHYEFDPYADCSLIFIATDDDKIVSTVRVFQREVWMLGRRVSMGGIGEVSTKPEYQGQGLASRLLSMAVDAMQARGMALSILFGEKPMYERAGWRFCPMSITDVDMPSLPNLAEGATIRGFVPDDLPYLMGMYDYFAGRVNGAVLRSPEYWRRWVLPQWALPGWKMPVVLVYEGRPVAYCHGDTDAEKGLHRIREFCAAPQTDKLLPGFLAAATQAHGLSAARIPTPLLPEIKGKRFTLDKLFMARVLAPFDGYETSDMLVAAIAENAGMFRVDMF